MGPLAIYNTVYVCGILLFLILESFFFPPTLFQCSFTAWIIAPKVVQFLNFRVLQKPGFKLSYETDALLDCVERKTGGVRPFTRAEQKLTVYFSKQIKLCVIILIANIKNE